jgi:hypothetical protein
MMGVGIDCHTTAPRSIWLCMAFVVPAALIAALCGWNGQFGRSQGVWMVWRFKATTCCCPLRS